MTPLSEMKKGEAPVSDRVRGHQLPWRCQGRKGPWHPAFWTIPFQVGFNDGEGTGWRTNFSISSGPQAHSAADGESVTAQMERYPDSWEPRNTAITLHNTHHTRDLLEGKHPGVWLPLLR